MTKTRTFSFKPGHTLMIGDEDIVMFTKSNYRHHILAEFNEDSSYGVPWVYNVNSGKCEAIPNPYHLKMGESLSFGSDISVMITRMAHDDFRVGVRTPDDRIIRHKKEHFIVSTIKDDENDNIKELRATRRPNKQTR